MIEIRNIEKTFEQPGGDRVQALRGVDLTMPAGEFLTVIGSNGSGKSTILNAIAGTFLPDMGTIRIAGADVTRLPEHRRARLIGRVFQDARLFSELTLRETVTVALEAHERSEFLPSLLGLPPSRRAELTPATELQVGYHRRRHGVGADGLRRLRACGSLGLGAACGSKQVLGLAFPPTTAQGFVEFSDAVLGSERIARLLAS